MRGHELLTEVGVWMILTGEGGWVMAGGGRVGWVDWVDERRAGNVDSSFMLKDNFRRDNIQDTR